MTITSSELARSLRYAQEWGEKRILELDRITTVDRPLQHYTSIDALEGMLQSGEMWFTDAYHLNDSGELHYGLNMAADVVNRHPLRRGPMRELFCAEVAKTLRVETQQAFRITLASFTRQRDDLGQWRAYSGDASGCCLGFASEIFQLGERSPLQYALLVADMIYDADHLAQEMSVVMNHTLCWLMRVEPAFYVASQEDRHEFLVYFSTETAKELLLIAMRAKHPGFKQEQEVRTTVVMAEAAAAPRLKYRARNGQRIPYLSLPIPIRDGGLAEVMLGAKCDAVGERRVRDALAAHGLASHVTVTRSTIPYR